MQIQEIIGDRITKAWGLIFQLARDVKRRQLADTLKGMQKGAYDTSVKSLSIFSVCINSQRPVTRSPTG